MPFSQTVGTSALVAFGCFMLVALNAKCKSSEEVDTSSATSSPTPKGATPACPHSAAQCESAKSNSAAAMLCPFMAGKMVTMESLSLTQRLVRCAVLYPALAGMSVGSLTLAATLAIMFRQDQRRAL